MAGADSLAQFEPGTNKVNSHAASQLVRRAFNAVPAGGTVKFGSILADDDPEAIRNFLKAVIELTDLEQFGVASFCASGAP
jgi:hypothetical protein